MDRQTARQRAAAAVVGRVFKASEGAQAPALRLDWHRDDEGDRDVGEDAGKFPCLLILSRRRSPSCAGCGARLAWSMWWPGVATLPGRGLQRYALCCPCREKDVSFINDFGG